MSVEIQTEDVLKLIMQYLKENGYSKSLKYLENES